MLDFGGVLKSTLGQVQRQSLIKGTVEKIVAEGFPSEEEVIELTITALGGKSKDKELLEEVTRLTRQAIKQHLYIQKSWPNETDCDKLDKAFTGMLAEGIIARQNWGETKDKGLALIRELIRAAGTVEKSEYAFYSAAETENALEMGELRIWFGVIPHSGKEKDDLSHKIIAALKTAGLTGAWSGIDNEPILLADLDWKKRRDET
jgi:hypothetical protein